MTAAEARTTLSRILVPVDGSPDAETALPVARALAAGSGAEVVLLRVAVADDAAEAKAYLADQAAAWSAGGPGRVRWLVWFAEPAPAIASAVADLDVDLVVMTTHGRRGLRRLLLGSVAEEVVRTAPVPVLLLRGAWPGPGPHADRVLVPLDGTERAEAILQALAWLPAGPATEVEILRVVEPGDPGHPLGPPTVGAGIRERLDEAQAYLAGAAARIEHGGRRVIPTVRPGLPADVIHAVAQEHDVKLIAMSTHGRRGLDRLLLGSVAEQVLRTTERPILLWRGAP